MRGLLMKNTAFNNTSNDITASGINSVRDKLNTDDSLVLYCLAGTESSIITALNTTPKISNTSQEKDYWVSTLTEKVNATVSDKIQLRILKLLKYIQTEMKENKNPSSNDGYSKATHKRKTARQTNMSKYCWSYEAYNHISSIWKF